MIRMAMAAAIFLSGCKGADQVLPDPSSTPVALAGIEWRATEIAGVPVLAQRGPWIRFDGEEFSGHGTCNSFSGRNAFPAPGRVDLSRPGATETGCLDRPLMDQEVRFFEALRKVTSYRLEADGSLTLLAPDGTSVRFARSQGF